MNAGFEEYRHMRYRALCTVPDVDICLYIPIIFMFDTIDIVITFGGPECSCGPCKFSTARILLKLIDE